MLALFRIVELSSGSITIDGYVHHSAESTNLTLPSIDISTIGLKDLRSKISIIPQDVCSISLMAEPVLTY